MLKTRLPLNTLIGMMILTAGLMTARANAAPTLGAPTNLTAAISAKAPLQVNLAWKDNAASETGFTIQRASNVYFKTGLITFTAGANAKGFTDTTVQKNNTYYYRVQARNAAGASAWSNPASAAATAPAAPVSLMGMQLPLSANAPTVKLAWRDNAIDEGGFTIQRATDSQFKKGVKNFTIGANGKGYLDTPAPAHATLYYRVQAFNGAGASAWTNTVTLSTPGELPETPLKLTFGSSTRNMITLRWTDAASDEDGFYLERSSVGFNGPWKRIATLKPDSMTYTDTGLAAKTTYWYRIQTYNENGNSAFMNVIQGTTKP